MSKTTFYFGYTFDILKIVTYLKFGKFLCAKSEEVKLV